MADFRQKLFQLRSYTPIPFLLVMVVFARPTLPLFGAGFIVLAAGELMRFWGVAYAGPLTRVTGSVGAPALVVSGPFSIVRNPLYVGNIVLYVGIGIMANALTPWLVGVALIYFSLQYAMIVSLEEDFLAKEFGERYETYKKAVPRFIPRILRWKPDENVRQEPDWKGAARSEKRTLQAIVLVTALVSIRWTVDGLW